MWSTPQVNQLLETASGDDEWLSNALPQEIKQWLSNEPSMGMSCTLNPPSNSDSQSLKVFFLGKANSHEYLLRLVNKDTEDEAAELKKRWELTGRESEVLYWITKGKTNREIGQILGTSPRTVNKHSEHIYKKLEVENRTTAATKALEHLQR